MGREGWINRTEYAADSLPLLKRGRGVYSQTHVYIRHWQGEKAKGYSEYNKRRSKQVSEAFGFNKVR